VNTFTIISTGSPTPNVTETGTLPSGVTWTDTGAGTARLSGSPVAGTAGKYSITVTASNGVNPNATQTFTLTVMQPPQLTSPVSGSNIGGSTTFNWTPSIPAASTYVLNAGIGGPGTTDLYSVTFGGTATSATINIPQNGVTVYVTLVYKVGGVNWSQAFEYVETGSPTLPTLTSPAAGTYLSGPTTFTWSPGTGVYHYELALGLGGPATLDLYASGAVASSVTSETVNIPANGALIYVTLYAMINGSWAIRQYTFREVGAVTPPVLTSPAPGSQLAGLTTFTWQAGQGISDYMLKVGTTGAQSMDLYYGGEQPNSVSSASDVNIPTKGKTVYATLGYLANGTWNWLTYTYTEGSITLSVAAVNSAGAVSIGVTPTDNNGLGPGTAPFTRSYQSGTPVTLTAPATAGGNVFSSWSGCASTSGTSCTVTMNAITAVTATYVPPTYTLTVNSTQPPAGVSVGVSPSDNDGQGSGTTGLTRYFYSGTTVTVTAPATWGGNVFSSWTGCPSASGPVCTAAINGNTTVTANYVGVAESLTVISVNTPGGLSVAASPADKNGATGGTTPFTLTYNLGSTITLTAPANSGTSAFLSWSGCTSASGVGCSVTLSGAETITANYALPQYTLTVNSSHLSTGAPIGISQADLNGNAGGTASFVRTYLGGTTVTLTAPSSVGGHPFLAWSGCTSSAGTTCTAAVNSNMTVQANYTVLLTPGPSRPVSNGGLVTGLSTQAIWRLTTNGTTGTISSQITAIPYPNLPFTITGTGTPCDGQRFTSTSGGTVVTFNTTLHCMYDLWTTNFSSTLSYNGWTSYVTGVSSTPNGAGGYTVTVDVRDYYPQTSGLPVAGGTGVPSGSTVTIAGTGTACDGAEQTINAQGTANQYDSGITGYQDYPPYKIQFTSANACSFHNAANVGRMAYMGSDSAGNLYMFGNTGGYDVTENPSIGTPTSLTIRKSTDGGNTWSAAVTLFADDSGRCNNYTDNCAFYAEDFVQAPNGNFVLWHNLYNWDPGFVSSGLGYSTCNPNTADCTEPASWVTTSYPYGAPGGGDFRGGGLYGFVMPNGTDIAAPLIYGWAPGYEYLLISHDNGSTWTDLIPVSDGATYTMLPTGETDYFSFGTDSILGFVRNLLSYPGCVNKPPNYQCGSPNGVGGLLMLYSDDDGATWTIEPVTIPQAQPICGGTPGASMVQYAYITPLLVPSTEPGMVTLTFGERQYCTSAITYSYLRAVTFDPAVVAAHPESIGNAQTLDWTENQYIGYGGMVQVGPSSFILSYEKGSSAAYGFISKTVMTATQP
jgi:hypothetical protein